MDSVLKLFYDKWDTDIPLANGDSRSCFILGTFYNSFRSHAVNTINDDCLYVYPIEISAATLSVLLDAEFVNSLSDVIDYLRSGKLKLLINLVHDPITGSENILKKFETKMNNAGIDSSNLILFFGSECPVETKMQMCCGLQSLLYQARELHSYPYTASGYTSDCMRVVDLDSTVVRPKKFLSPNNMMKEHRIFLAYTLVQNEMLNDGLFSFIEPRTARDIATTMRYYTGEADNTVSETLSSMLPYELDTKGLTPEAKRSIIGHPGNVKQWYEDSYLHIATETTFSNTSKCFISEKVFRLIINLQPFLLFGDAGCLTKLKELGFKTFAPFIDESYDLEYNPGKRSILLRAELLKLHNMSLQEIHDWYYSITDILVHNQQHLSTFANADCFTDGLEKIYKYYKHE